MAKPGQPTRREPGPFGANLRQARLRARLTQRQLAARADLNSTTIVLYERGTRLPNLRALLRIMRALNVAPETLLKGY